MFTYARALDILLLYYMIFGVPTYCKENGLEYECFKRHIDTDVQCYKTYGLVLNSELVRGWYVFTFHVSSSGPIFNEGDNIIQFCTGKPPLQFVWFFVNFKLTGTPPAAL